MDNLSAKAIENLNTLISGLGIDLENDTIEENCGTIWVTDVDGDIVAITTIETEN